MFAKTRKLTAAVMALALLAMPLHTSLADPIADQIITGDAGVDYIDPAKVISFTVPTSASLGFTLDPQNLAATQGVGAWDPDKGGSIIPAAVNIVTNMSAVPLKVTVHFELSDDLESNPVILVNDEADVNTGTAKNMYLSFVPADAKTLVAKAAIDEITAPEYVQDEDADKVFATPTDLTSISDDAATAQFGQFVATGTGGYYQVQVPAHDAVPATVQTTVSAYTDDTDGFEVPDAAALLTDMTAGADLAFALNSADYYVLKTADGYELKYDGAARNDNYDTGSFILSGIINKNADWSGYTGETKISVSATYSFEVMTSAEYTAATTSKLTGTYNSLSLATVSGVEITDGDVSVLPGGNHTFAATVSGENGPSTAVTWSLEGSVAAGTAIDPATGELTVDAEETAASFTVKATSVANSAVSDTVTVTVGEPAATVVSVAVTPDTASIAKGGTQQFDVTVEGENNPAQTVTWSVNSTLSSISTDGLLTVAAGETAATLTVTATSTVDETKSGTATVTVTAPVTPGFTDEGGTASVSKTYTYSKATNANLTIGFNFAGNTITSISVTSGGGTAPAPETGYVVNTTNNTITLQSSWLATLGTVPASKVYTIVMNGVSYTLNLKVTT